MKKNSIFQKNKHGELCDPVTSGRMKRNLKVYCAVVLAVFITCFMGMTAFAADDPLTVVNNLSDFIFGLIRAIGLILLGVGIMQVGLSFKSHDPSQRANGFLTVAGGIIITFAKEILNLITG
ncbi:MAG: glutamyl-tRNA amidotransferase [Clostridia bacterium]|nr:glutamyl-tRNA amidotransferase [Clostridia bacterium]